MLLGTPAAQWTESPTLLAAVVTLRRLTLHTDASGTWVLDDDPRASRTATFAVGASGDLVIDTTEPPGLTATVATYASGAPPLALAYP